MSKRKNTRPAPSPQPLPRYEWPTPGADLPRLSWPAYLRLISLQLGTDYPGPVGGFLASVIGAVAIQAASLGATDRQDEELRLCLDAYEGRPFLNVRIWTRDTDGRGWWPSKRGVTFKLRELADVAEALAAALDLMAEHQDGRPALPPATPHPRRDRARPALPSPQSAGGGEDFDEFA